MGDTFRPLIPKLKSIIVAFPIWAFWINGPVFTTGKVANALSFDGVDDHVVMPLTSFPSQSFTFDLWVKAVEPRTLITKLSGASNDQIGSWFGTSGNLCVKVYGANGSGQREYCTNQGGFDDDDWHHVAFVVVDIDGSITKEVHIYVDGVEKPHSATPFGNQGVPYDVSNSAPFRLGILDIGQQFGPLEGLVDEVGLYDRALAASEIQAIFNAGSAGKCKPIIIPTASEWGLAAVTLLMLTAATLVLVHRRRVSWAI